MHKATTNILVQTFFNVHMFLFLFGKSLGVGWLGRCMLVRTHKHFPKVIVLFYSLISDMWESSYIFLHLLLPIILIYGIIEGVKEHLIEVYFVFL